MKLLIRLSCGGREDKGHGDDIVVTLGSIPDTDDEWDDGPAAGVHAPLGHFHRWRECM